MKYFLLILVFFISSCSSPEPGTDEWFKEKHKELKKKVNIAEKERNLKRGQETWHDLRTLKKIN